MKLCMEAMPKSIFTKQVDEKLLHGFVHSCVQKVYANIGPGSMTKPNLKKIFTS